MSMKLLYILIFSLFASVANAGTIVLLVDVSSSIYEDKLKLQMDSYARAMREIPGLQNVNIEVITFSVAAQRISSGSAEDAAKAFENYPIVPAEHRGHTCLVNALIYVNKLVDTMPQPVILDVSGDGEANCENRNGLTTVLDWLAAKDVRINTLYINNGMADDRQTVRWPGDDTNITPLQFFQRMTRNHGFTIYAKSFYDFEFALFEKLMLEVAMLD